MAFEHTIRVAFDDVDAAGIVYFARVLDYCHRAYEAFLEARGIPLPEMMAGSWGAPIVRVECDYARPLRHGDRLVVEVEAARTGRSSLEMAYTVRASGGEVAARARIIHAAVDLERFASIPLPESFREAVERA